MFRIFYANPTIDKTVRFHEFHIGATNRPYEINSIGAGKPLNLASTLKKLNAELFLHGFLFSGNAQMIEECLNNERISYSLKSYPGMARINTKFFDASCSVVTEINEYGDSLDENAAEEILTDYLHALKDSDIAVLAGSISKGLPKDCYARIAAFCSENSLPFFIDAEGESLRTALSYEPLLIKPNAYEFSLLCGKEILSADDVLPVLPLFKDKAKNICVSLGDMGAVYFDGKDVYFAEALPLNIKTTVGAGDAMAAGLLFGLSNGYSSLETLKLGMACSAAQIEANVQPIANYMGKIFVRRVFSI